jgi:uncharacterized protein YlxW (UPF0749 family)
LNDVTRANQQYAKVEAQDKAKIKELEKENEKLQTDINALQNKVIIAQSEVQQFKDYAENNLMNKDGRPYKKP